MGAINPLYAEGAFFDAARASTPPGTGAAPAACIRPAPTSLELGVTGGMTSGTLRRVPSGILGLLSGILCLLFAAGTAQAVELSHDNVVWWDSDQASIPEPKEREPNIVWDSVEDTILLPADRLFNPVRLTRRVGTLFGGDHVEEAADINSLGEVLNSSWFTNRIGLFPMSVEDVVRGPGTGNGPDRSQAWTVVSAKTEGVTPGFNIRDARGDTYLIKFDPKGFLELTTCAGVVCTKIFHAAGYNVPDDVTVRFRRDDLVLADDVRIKLADGTRRQMTDADLDEILNSVDRLESGEWFAISSRFLSGKPIGPFNYYGRRKDDPNDRIDHDDRRSLRGLYVFASWLNHFDTKQHNSLDMFVEEDGRSFVKHYLIDFASTLGSGAKGPQPRHGYEYTIDFPAIGGRLLSLGLHESTWRKRSRPEGLRSVGYFDVKHYDPIEFKPLQPNTAFANRTGEDGYWAARIITAFTDAHIDGIVESAGYTDSASARYVAATLQGRRDRIGRKFFDEIPPLEFFRMEEDRIVFRDLGAERGIYSNNIPFYRSRWARVDEEGRNPRWSEWIESTECFFTMSGTMVETSSGSMSGTRGDLRGVPGSPGNDLQEDARSDSEREFLAVQSQVRRSEGWSPVVTAYLSLRTGRTVAMDR